MESIAQTDFRAEAGRLPATSLAERIDRWIFVCMATSFLLIALLGFIPDSLAKISAVRAGERPAFPPILHLHAVLMGSFLLVLLAQAVLGARGDLRHHRRLGMLGAWLVPPIIVTGVVLVPTMFGEAWQAAQAAPIQSRRLLQGLVQVREDIILLQLRAAVLFPVFMVLALRARATDPGFHKRMMFLAVATILPAAIDRLTWLPSTFPASAAATDLYTLLVVSPMFLWDRFRHRTIWKPYLVWAAVNAPLAVAVHALWGTAWWHSIAPRLIGMPIESVMQMRDMIPT